MATYVTEVAAGNREPTELQVMHKRAMTEPEEEARAAQLAGDDPRPASQNPGRNQPMSTATTCWAPTRGDLDAATARTEAAIISGAPPADILRAAELEEATHNGYLQRPRSDEKLQRDAEAEWECEAGA